MKKRLLCLLLMLTLLLTLCPAAYAAPEDLRFSDSLVAFIKEGEGFRAEPYGGPGGWYIGYGCACNPSDYPYGITEAEAEALLRSKMESFAASVRSFLKKYGVSVTQSQFDAMCAMSYALGPAWLNAANRLPSYLINGISNYTDQEIASAFGAWCHVGGAVSVPALKRRIMEAKMFLYGDYTHSAEGWTWVTLDANGGSNALSDVAVYKLGEPYAVLPEASRSGYYFAGWQTEAGTTLSVRDTAQGALSLKAIWSETPVETEPPLETKPPVESEPPTESETPDETEKPAEDKTPEVPELPYPDVPVGSWYAEKLARLTAEGVFHGGDDGKFNPDNSVTWGEALKLVLRAGGYAKQDPPEDTEGKGVHWAQGYLDFAEKKGFLTRGKVTDLNAKITRNEIADLCAAALELTAPAGMENPFADTDRASVLALYHAQILYGSVENGKRLYKGSNFMSRSEICSVLVLESDYVARELILLSGHRIPIDDTLRPNPYDDDAFRVVNGRLVYDDGETVSRAGIDVSYYQGDIDWQKVAADGIDYAILRCGYRGYSTGEIHEDDKFKEYIAGASAAGLDVGVYFFSQATTVEEAQEEAAFTLELIKNYNISYPVVFDWEPVTNSGSRTRNFDGKTVTDCTEAFCEAVAAAGYTPMAYFNKQMAYLHLDLHRLQKYDGWFAWYHEYPDFVYDYQMWQYGSSGKVAGIAGNVDMNISFVDFAAR